MKEFQRWERGERGNEREREEQGKFVNTETLGWRTGDMEHIWIIRCITVSDFKCSSAGRANSGGVMSTVCTLHETRHN